MVHSFLRSHRLLSSLVAPTALLATSSTLLEAEKPQRETLQTQREQPEPDAPPAVDFIGVFVEAASAARLRERFPRTCRSSNAPLVVVLQYQPTHQEQEAFARILGTKAQLQVQGVVEDTYAQTVSG